ncbi:unnamed protein product [Didymodactylos carnosus]|uniref:Uncharacterized protein n=1 Tax=Didymodactylos carnosus TaxID=1234261 RepID=A0A816BZD8_9BILA|nr:unnamed protein product [Didymodactylos carnosus]CAF1615944.1 unnamed protein product [Didymodactylos carnosus]CAF3905791.1 unnamed protein product [Didymodactylos carnosus]CAF4502699.1 unnamed protein product [Didymodactylos carnosus]
MYGKQKTQKNEQISAEWHYISHKSTDSTLTFTFSSQGSRVWYLDDVSVIHTQTSSEMLINGDFASSLNNGWTQYCNTNDTCGGGKFGQLTTSNCHGGVSCFTDHCLMPNLDYLTQTFTTIPNDLYVLSFWIRVIVTGGPAGLAAYVSLY